MNLLKEKKDEVLFKEGCKGNEQSFNVLYSRYNQKMERHMRWKYGFLKDKIDDISNDVWVKLWKACCNPGPNEYFGKYLWRTLKNNIYDNMRKDQTKKKYFQDNSVESDNDFRDTRMPPIEEIAIIEQQIKTVEDCLLCLSNIQREAFLMFVVGKTSKEISKSLNIKEEAAKSRVRQARDRLKECLPRDYYENDS